MAPLPRPSGASPAQPFQISSNMQQNTTSPTIAMMTAPTANMPALTYMMGGYPVTLADPQTTLPATLPINLNVPSGLPTNIANNPSSTTMQGEHGLASSTNSSVNDYLLGSSNANDQQPLPNIAGYSYSIDMDVTPIVDPIKTAAPAPKQTCTSLLERRKIHHRSAKLQGGWSRLNAKEIIPQRLAHRLKDKFRAKVIADCRAEHFNDCRRDTEALVNKGYERKAKEHAAQLDSQRILAEKAIREARGDRANQLKSIRSLEQAKRAAESEVKAKDQQIRDLDLQKQSVTAERAVEQIDMLRKAKEAALENAAKEIMDLQAENAGLKEQVDNVKEDLKASTVKVEDLQTILVQEAKSIRNLTNSVDKLESIVAEQAQALANFNSIMVDFKNVNNALVKESTSLKSGKAVLEDKVAKLLENFYAERKMKENLEKQMVDQAAVGLDITATAPAEAVPTTEASTAAIFQDDSKLSESTTLVIPAVASAPKAFPFRNIFGNMILFAYCFLFGNLILSFGLFSLLLFSGTKLFFSASSNIIYTDLSAEEETGPTAIDTDTDRKIATSMLGGWGCWEGN